MKNIGNKSLFQSIMDIKKSEAEQILKHEDTTDPVYAIESNDNMKNKVATKRNNSFCMNSEAQDIVHDSNQIKNNTSNDVENNQETVVDDIQSGTSKTSINLPSIFSSSLKSLKSFTKLSTASDSTLNSSSGKTAKFFVVTF